MGAPTKRCPQCGKKKPLDDFAVRSRNPDGSPRTRWSYCRPCKRQQNREYSARNAEALRERRRARYREQMADPAQREKLRAQWREKQRRYLRKMREERPEAYAAHQHYQRVWWGRRRATERKSERQRRVQNRRIILTARRRDNGVPEVASRRRTDEVAGERVPQLPVGPFKDWLLERLPRYESPNALADKLGIDQSVIVRILRGEKRLVSLDTVDLALVNEGSTFLVELYPIEEDAA